MTNAGHGATQASGPGFGQGPFGYETGRAEQGPWAGWVAFAGAMLIIVGLFQVVEGLVALLNRNYYLVGPNDLVVNVDYGAWGTVHLIVGIVAVLAGFGVMAGVAAARVVGIVLASLSAIVNLGFIPAYPFWAIIVIVIDVVVIYALAVHGRELAG